MAWAGRIEPNGAGGQKKSVGAGADSGGDCLVFAPKNGSESSTQGKSRRQTLGRTLPGTHLATWTRPTMHWWTLQQLKSRKPRTRREAVEKLLAEENVQAVDV